MRWVALFGLLMVQASCLGGPAGSPAEVSRGDLLVMGDSILAWNRGQVAQVIGAGLERDVTDRSRSGARVSGAGGTGWIPDIASQYRGEAYGWVILDGGGNDLMGECGCGKCAGVLDQLVSADGQSGEIPTIIDRILASGARVLLVGYYPVSDLGGPFEVCRDELAMLGARMAKTGAGRQGVLFTSLGEVIGRGDLHYYGPDRVHPTPAGSDRIGQHLVQVIRTAEGAAPALPAPPVPGASTSAQGF